MIIQKDDHFEVMSGSFSDHFQMILDSFSYLLLLAITSNLLVLGWTACIKSMNRDCGFPKDEYNFFGLPFEYTKANSFKLY